MYESPRTSADVPAAVNQPPGVAAPSYDLAIILPAFNEIDGIERTLARSRDVISLLPCSVELIVVDDGSTDGTAEKARACGARVVSHPINRGYGAALKTGILMTTAPAVMIMDADLSYRPEAIPRLLDRFTSVDMVVGARVLTAAGVPMIRRPAKWILNRFAGFLVGQRVPDLNSGQRIMRRGPLMRYLHLLPNGFSFTSTITLALLANAHPVIYEPIEYDPRTGRSKIRPAHFLGFLLLVVRSTVLFNPLKVFLPLGAILFVIGLGKLVQDVYLQNLSETAVMAFLSALVVTAIGLLADMISRLQLNPPWRP